MQRLNFIAGHKNVFPCPTSPSRLESLRPTRSQRSGTKQYDFVEFIERSGTAGAGTYSRQIAVFWADRGLPALGKRDRATQYLTQALAINPTFDLLQAEVARQALHALTA